MHRLSTKMALSGVVCALALLLMLVPYLVPYAEIASPALAGLLLAVLVIEINRRWATIAFVAVALLSYLLAAKMPAVLFFVFLGYYPIVKSAFESLKSKALGWVLKIALVYAAAAAGIGLGALLFGFVIPKTYRGIWDIAAAVLLLPLFVLYDRVLTGCVTWYIRRLHRQILKIFSR